MRSPMPATPSKAEVRQAWRAALAQQPSTALAAFDAAIAEQLRPMATPGQTVLAFYPLRSEPDIRPVLHEWLGSGVRLALPRVESDGSAMSAYGVGADIDSLPESRWGVREPDPSLHPSIPPASLDLALVPGVAFTRTGERLGRGGGHYDRFLASLTDRTLTVGVCRPFQLLDDLPREPHDRPVARVVSGLP